MVRNVESSLTYLIEDPDVIILPHSRLRFPVPVDIVARMPRYCAKLVALDVCSEKPRKPTDKLRCHVVAELPADDIDSISGSALTPLTERRYKIVVWRQRRRYIAKNVGASSTTPHVCELRHGF